MNINKIFTNEIINDNFVNLVENHRMLDDVLRDDKGKLFISDWYCYHPFIDKFTQNIEVTDKQKQDYIFYSDDYELKQLISKMHMKFDKKFYDSDTEILPSDGSSPSIATFCFWLYKNNIKEVYYLSPLYYTFYYFFELFKIKARPISGKQGYEKDFTMNLPDKKTLLIICDPIWYAGQSIKKELINEINEWQKTTKSYIFVDGSFQYTQWSDDRFEETSIFDKNYTFRLICPTKFLALHGYRFSYLLLPSNYYEEFLYLYGNNIGSTNAYNTAFAKKAISIMLEDSYNIELTNFVKNIYNLLCSNGTIRTIIIPNCGYFIFGEVIKNTDNFHSMTQKYFEQKNFPNYCRINLLGGKNLEPLMKF